MTLLLSSRVQIDTEKLKRLVKSRFGKTLRERKFYKHLTDFRHGETLFVAATDEELKVWLATIRHKELTLYIIPNEHNPLATAYFALPRSLEQLLDAPATNAYLTLADGAVVLDRVTTHSREHSFFIDKPKLFKTTITFGDQRLTTAITRIEAANERRFKESGYNFFDENSCNRCALLLFSPRSMLDLLRATLFKKAASLPPGTGLIKSEQILMEFEEEVPVVIDGEPCSKRRLSLMSLKTPFRIATPLGSCQTNQKDLVRTDWLLKDPELITFLTRRPLPLFPIASEAAFAELFTKIRHNAKISAPYLTLLIISVLMATLGLFQNSAPTIIGAMILAPLMAPIISLAMGIIRLESSLIKNSLKLLLLSIAIVLTLAAALTQLFPYQHLTEQMALRTNPTLLDLAVAILSGIAAAYGYANTKVGESLAGVAIAVALVPPLSVAGIGLGWGELEIFWQAFLLFLANIAGILFAAGSTFYVLGFASQKYASAAITIKLLLLLSISVPLWISTKAMLEQEKIYTSLKQYENIQILRITPTTVEVNIAARSEREFEQILTKLKPLVKGRKIVASYERVVE